MLGAVEARRLNEIPKLELANKTSDVHILPLGNSQEAQDGRMHFLRNWSCSRDCVPTALDESPVVIHNSWMLWPPGPHAVANVLYYLNGSFQVMIWHFPGQHLRDMAHSYF